MCFINLDKIKEFQNIILKKLDIYEKLNTFIKYLKTYLFKLYPKIYNYSELINHFQNQNNDNIFLEKLYTINIIFESLNGKISYYLPKKVINNFNFVNASANVLSNELF